MAPIILVGEERTVVVEVNLEHIQLTLTSEPEVVAVVQQGQEALAVEEEGVAVVLVELEGWPTMLLEQMAVALLFKVQPKATH